MSEVRDTAIEAALEDAARELAALVKAHRVAGDEDLEAALTRVEGLLSAQDAR